ncbi:hypothetical protein [Ureaplasma ceti]|uniref:Cardiolipin synthase N-terminal domain-containing protein n=1 Tax=Ureaplasma ceti TaxID=3119530 RepID=A0ABP9U5V9_9BACT
MEQENSQVVVKNELPQKDFALLILAVVMWLIGPILYLVFGNIQGNTNKILTIVAIFFPVIPAILLVLNTFKIINI